MALTPVTEFFNGGLVTARHPALLNPGELQRADDTVYRDKDPAIWRAPGRQALNATALGSPSAVKGVTHCSYERTRTDQIVAYSGTALFRSDLTTTAPPVLDPLSFVEISNPAQVAGTISSTTTFTATTGFPFLIDAIGANVYGPGVDPGTYVTAVSNQSGSTGHYSTITISAAMSNGAATLTLDFGVTFDLANNGDEILDSVQFGTAYFAWFGRGAPRRLSWRGRRSIAGTAYLDTLVSRPMGLDAVRTAPTVTEASDASYAWNPLLGVGYYWFLITEVFAPGGDVVSAEKDANLRNEIVESAYLAPDPTSLDPNGAIGRPLSANLTAVTGKGIQIVFPAVTNVGLNGRIANNWAVYMYGPTLDGVTAPSLAQFRRVAVYKITQFTAGFTKVLFQTSLAPQRVYPTTHAADDGQSEFENAANMTGAPDHQVGFAKSPSSTDAPGVTNAVNKMAGYTFNTSGAYATASIVGIAVEVTGSADTSGNAGRDAGYYVHVDTTTKHTPQLGGVFRQYGTITHGGPLDTIGVAWVVGDLATISVTVGKTGTGSRQRLAIDAVGLRVYFNASEINLNGPAYRVVTYRDQIGLTVNEPVNLPPPECSTGDFFQGMLALNDLSDETAIRYSLPGRPEAFPKPYVLRLNATRRHDRVTVIRALGQILIVGLENSIERVAYLPRETNTDLTDGLSHEAYVTDHGIAGPLAVARFDIPGKGTVLAYASSAGVFMTDGITTIPLNLDLDWPNTVKFSALSSCVFRVYPREKWLVLYYCPAGASHSRNTRALVFSYAADKIKSGGFLPCTGPLVVSGRSSCEVNIGGTSYLFTGHETDGKIYQEDFGVTQATSYQVHNASDVLASAPILPAIKSRKFFAAGIDRDVYGEAIYLLFSAYGATITATATTTVGSTTLLSSAAFGSVVAGMRIQGAGIDPGTIVKSVTNASILVLSRAANATATGVMTFDTGTVGVTIRGSSVGEISSGLSVDYLSTLVGDLVHFNRSNTRRGFELQIEKVPLTFTTTGLRFETATSSDLSTNMRLHNITYMVEDNGPDTNRSVA